MIGNRDGTHIEIDTKNVLGTYVNALNERFGDHTPWNFPYAKFLRECREGKIGYVGPIQAKSYITDIMTGLFTERSKTGFLRPNEKSAQVNAGG